MHKIATHLGACLIALTLSSCSETTKVDKGNSEHPRTEQTAKANTSTGIPAFSKDSAYLFVTRQCEFGERVPNTPAHEKCADYLCEQLAKFGAEVTRQKHIATAFDGTKLNSTNIIGTFFPNKGRRVILFSHWDSRPFCDQDEASYKNTPVMGANDGASGVAVLLELARLFQEKEPAVGVDIVFLDTEDYGDPDGNSEDSWCLGTQYWAKNPHYTRVPQYGILLDMVGGDNPHFGIDAASQYYAKDVVSKVWNIANGLGHKEFKNETSGQIIDDHVYVNMIAGIPTIDIIDFNHERGFPSTWHTHNDTPANINKETLGIVGDVVTNVIFRE